MGDALVQLRPQAESDAPNVLRWRSRPAALAELFSDHVPTLDEHLAWLKSLGEQRREFIIVALPGEVPIGTIGLSGIDRVHGHAEYGILLGEPAYEGKGYARAASERILELAFGDLGLHRVYLRVFPENARARKLYAALGFAEEGVLCEHVRKGGRYRDVLMMGLLESAWRKHQSRS
jgi:UDP-4-amino-4,6-dideoxy-N-acetyl-beta-L-altrosamine N-acetyltransferase